MSGFRMGLALGLFMAGLGAWGQSHAAESAGSFFDGIKRLWSGGSENTVAFTVDLQFAAGGADLKEALEDASALAAQSENGAPSVQTLLAIAREEPARLTAALYQQGYYGGRIEISVAGAALDRDLTQAGIAGDRPIPVVVRIDPGPEFRFGDIRIEVEGGEALDAKALDIAEMAGLVSGRLARSNAILQTGQSIIAGLKLRGFAFAKVEAQDVTADHASRTVSISMSVAAGPKTRFGDVEVRGTERYSEVLLRSRAAIPAGETYSPKALDAARKRLTKLEGVAGVRIVEGAAPGADGRIPLVIEVTERKPHYFGANAAISSVDGAELNAYWGDRNVFGGGETLRFDGTVSNLGGDAVEDLEYEFKASYGWPSLMSAYTDYRTSALVRHEDRDSYESDEAEISGGIVHRFRPDLTGDAALQLSWLETEDALGASEFFLLSVPAELIYDTRDNPLDPAGGWRMTLFAEPVADLQDGGSYVRSRAQLSTYARLGATPSIVAAARLGAGTIAGADLRDVPAPDRFLAGGGGSVRGYGFRSVGPVIGGERIGGLSIVELSGELRIRLTETIGIVPFADAAFVSSESFFSGESETVAGVGLGLRYHTPIGPVRVDVATPLDRFDDEPELVVYVGLGQAF